MGRREPGDGGEQRAADRGGEARGTEGSGGLSGRVEVEAGGVDRGKDGDRVLGQPAPGRGEPDAPSDGLDECGAHLGGERRDLLGHRRRRDAQLVGDSAHRTEPGQFEQEVEAAGLHSEHHS
jgi:hypothetical protein